METLWTPWRMKYILAKKVSDCIFCEKPSEKGDRENYILYRGRTAFIMLNAYPYNNGHLMVVAYEHVGEIEALSSDVLTEMMQLVQQSVVAIKKAMRPDGFNIGINLGHVAGAGIVDHLHIHVVPRWMGDTNFMPVLSETRLIPELLAHTYDRLLAAGIGQPLMGVGSPHDGTAATEE
ncbi:MAG: HIT domain-containing protein [Chloroflexi bacterium]|nr:HIT domain-containing protein [Chloroflexota bacterium]